MITISDVRILRIRIERSEALSNLFAHHIDYCKSMTIAGSNHDAAGNRGVPARRAGLQAVCARLSGVNDTDG